MMSCRVALALSLWLCAAPASADDDAAVVDETEPPIASAPSPQPSGAQFGIARALGIGVVALGAGFLGVGAGFEAKASQERSSYERSWRFDRGTRDAAIEFRDAATALFITSGVIAATGVALVVFNPGASQGSQSALSVELAPGGAALRLVGM